MYQKRILLLDDMIKYVKGNLLESNAQALVNTVNTVGVMGKGIALQFKEAYPNNYNLYRKACRNNEVQIGKMFITEEGDIYNGIKYIVNFPTKTTWKKPSEYSYIEKGLADLRQAIVSYKWKSIAIPPLGAHNGGLDWSRVKNLVINALEDLPCEILLYEPSDVIVERMKAERVKLTPARAMLLFMLCDLTSQGEFVSEFAAEKIAYFLQKFGAEDIFKLHFKQYYYGPYSGKVRFVLYHMNGSYVKGVGQMEQKAFDPIWLTPDSLAIVKTYFSDPKNKQYLDICKRTASFLSGYYSNYLLELLSTVDYILSNEKDVANWRMMDRDDVLAKVVDHINAWSERKKYLFSNSEHIQLVLSHLYQF